MNTFVTLGPHQVKHFCMDFWLSPHLRSSPSKYDIWCRFGHQGRKQVFLFYAICLPVIKSAHTNSLNSDYSYKNFHGVGSFMLLFYNIADVPAKNAGLTNLVVVFLLPPRKLLQSLMETNQQLHWRFLPTTLLLPTIHNNLIVPVFGCIQ